MRLPKEIIFYAISGDRLHDLGAMLYPSCPTVGTSTDIKFSDNRLGLRVHLIVIYLVTIAFHFWFEGYQISVSQAFRIQSFDHYWISN